jgi:hypothetical protein
MRNNHAQSKTYLQILVAHPRKRVARHARGRYATIGALKTITESKLEENGRIFMSENETEITASATTEAPAPPEPEVPAVPAPPAEDITYHAVEKEGVVTAIWEMQGRKHLRTIDPRSRHGQEILRLYTADHHDEIAATSH